MAEWARTGSSESLAALVTAWCNRVQACPAMSLQEGMSVKKAIADFSFPEQQRTEMLQVVEAKVMQCCAEAEAPKDVKGQLLLKPSNYLTAADWGGLETGAGPARLQILLKRYLSLGLLNLKEGTVKAGMALLLGLAAPTARSMPSYAEIYEQVKVFKRSFEQLKEAHLAGPGKSQPVGMLRYPENAHDLSEELFKAAYPDGHPMSKDIGADIWLAHIPMRSTSKLLKGPKNPDPQCLPPVSDADRFESLLNQTLDRVFSPHGPLGAVLQNVPQTTSRRQLDMAAGASVLRPRVPHMHAARFEYSVGMDVKPAAT